MAYKSNNTKIGLVLGIGGVKCSAALGMKRVFDREKISIDNVVGCCAGSLYASGIALGIDADTLTKATLSMWTKKITEKNKPLALLKAVFPKFFGFDEQQFQLRNDTEIVGRLNAFFKGATFNDTNIPLSIVATDIHNGERVVIKSGSITDAIRASIAIPFVFSPWKIGNRVLADGFLSDPLPIDVAIDNKSDIIIAMGFENLFNSRLTSANQYGSQVLGIMINNLMECSFQKYTMMHPNIIRINPKFDKRIGLFDTDSIPYVIKQAELETEKKLPDLISILSKI